MSEWDGYWLDPIAMSKIQHAVKAKQKVVSFNDMTFKIEYGHSFPSEITGEKNEAIKLSRTDVDPPAVPFGYIGMTRILNFEFEE